MAISYSSSSAFVNEGNTVSFLFDGFFVDTLNWTVTSGSARLNSDYTGTGGSIRANKTDFSIPVELFRTINDNIYEGNETLTLRMWTSTYDRTYYYNISDEASRPRLSISTNKIISEQDGSFLSSITVNATNAAAFNYDIKITTGGGSAVSGQDFEGLDTTLTMRAGQTTVSTEIKILGDLAKEGDETFNITASSTLGSSTTAVVIKDNDPAPKISKAVDVYGTEAQDISDRFYDATKIAAGIGYGVYSNIDADMAYISYGSGSPLSKYYIDAPAAQTKFQVYHGAFENTGRLFGYWEHTTQAIDVITTAYVEYNTTGKLGQNTARQTAQVVAALYTGFIGSIVAGEVTITVAAMTVGAGALVGAGLPIIAGLAAAATVDYLVGGRVSYIATQGLNHLYGSNNVTTQSLTNLETQSVTTKATIDEYGSVGSLKLGVDAPKAAWSYDTTTKLFTWLDENKKSDFERSLKFVDAKDGNVINGSNATYAGMDTLVGSHASDIITRTDNQKILIGGDGNDYINGSGSTSVLIDAGMGDDTLIGATAKSILRGGEGNDHFIGQVAFSGPNFIGSKNGLDIWDGGAGSDTLDFSGSDTYSVAESTKLNPLTMRYLSAISVNLNEYQTNIDANTSGIYATAASLFSLAGQRDYVQVKYLQNIENVIGPNNYKSSIVGNDKDNNIIANGNFSYLSGNSGNDTITSLGNGAALEGGLGDDTLTASKYANILSGGDGYDIAKLNFKLVDILNYQYFPSTTAYTSIGENINKNIYPAQQWLSVDNNIIHVSGVERFEFSDGTLDLNNGSALYEKIYYARNNHDVWNSGQTAEQHYNSYGWQEGRNPNEKFSTAGYLATNSDVEAAGINPLTHYDQYGWKEGRDPAANFDNEIYLARSPDVKAAGINPLVHYLQYGRDEGRPGYSAVGKAADLDVHPAFDAEYYLLSNLDVGKAAQSAGINTFEFAYQHYKNNGWHEGRDPNAVFDTKGYLNAYSDVKASGIDPLMHYDLYGWQEDRNPSAEFNTHLYKAANPDVASAHIDPMLHYLQFGLLEGRSGFEAGIFGPPPWLPPSTDILPA